MFLIILATVFSLGMLITGYFLSPKASNAIKNSTYECGMTSFKNDKVSFHPVYFTYAIMFIVFDAEILLLFPFALAFDKLQVFVFLQALIFILIMLISLIYAIKKNMLRFR